VQKLVGVEAGARADEGKPAVQLPLSVCAMARSGSLRLTAVLEFLRPLVAETVVAVDDRAEAEVAGLVTLADKVVLFPHRDPGDSLIPWLHSQCASEWILNIDDDEVPSATLLTRLPELLAAEVTHWWLPRRWLVGSVDTFLDQAPWVPDYQLRLYRNDPATLRFLDEFHRPLVVSGPAGFARDPLWHLDCVLNSFECRRSKVLAYERSRRGMRVAGLAHNSSFYLPELQPDARTAPVPEADLRLIRAVLDTPAPAAPAHRGSLRRASREEIDAYWPGEPFDRSLWSGRLTRLETLERLPVRARHTITVAVENRSRVIWRRGPDAAPLVQVGTRWLAEDGTVVEHGLHTPLPADLPAGHSSDVPVHLRAPEQPGRYRLALDLVHEHVRWFNCALEWTVEVTPAHRIALLGQAAGLEQALDRIQLEPSVEAILVERDATVTPERYGHTRVPGLGGYLLAGIDARIGPLELARLLARTAKLLRSARHLRTGKPSAPLPRGAEECLRGLADCERLLITGPDWQHDAAPTRQLWRLAATAATARRLGLAVDVEPDALAPTDPVDRLLAALVRRSLGSNLRPWG
jgi:hypothetical protein